MIELCNGVAGRLSVPPIEGVIDHRRLRHSPRVIPKITRQIFVRVADHVTKHFVRPIHLAGDRLCVRIDEQLRAVETHPALRIVRAVNAIAVKLSRLDIRKKNVPDLVCLLRQRDANVFLRCVKTIEEAEIDRRGRLGKERKIYAVAQPRRSERIGIAQPNFYRRHKMSGSYPLRFCAWQRIKNFCAVAHSASSFSSTSSSGFSSPK